jgi:CRP/FNR family transcriptional regulator, anaerobic regulatory protein
LRRRDSAASELREVKVSFDTENDMPTANEPLARSSWQDVRSARLMAGTMPATTNDDPCKTCAIHQFCAMNPEEFAYAKQMDELVLCHRPIRKGEALHHVGDAFKNIYAVRKGSFKKVSLLSDGREQVTGFYLAGELLGLDGISSGQYASDAIALEDSTVCIMPFELLELLSREVKTMPHHVYRMLSAEVVRDNNLMVLLGTMTADERVATFLLDLSHRLEDRASSSTELVLRMTREETGSFLGIKLETVSRTLSRFQKEGLIEVHGREVRIVNLDGLRAAGHMR